MGEFKAGKSSSSLEGALKDFAKNNPPGNYALKVTIVTEENPDASDGDTGQDAPAHIEGRITEYKVDV